MKEIYFFQGQYAESLKGMARLLNKAETVYNSYKQYPNLPIFSQQRFEGLIRADVKYLHSLIETAAGDDLRDMQKNRPYMAPAAIIIPTIQEIMNQLGSFADGCHQLWIDTQNNFLRPIVDSCYLDFDAVTGQPTFSERGKAEIKEKCTIVLTKQNQELVNIMTDLQTTWLKAQNYLKNRNLTPNPIRFAIDPKARQAMLIIDREGGLHFNRLLF